MSEPRYAPIAGIELIREIGRGGTAVVYEANHPERGRIALKVLTDGEEDTRRGFVREHALASRVADAAVVPIYELVRTDEDVLACVMELVDGDTLDALAERGEAPRSRAVAIVASAARALASLHAAGIVHRDVKPTNILVEKAGRVRILDLGIAKDLRDPEHRDDPEVILGTPSYLSPEQAQAHETSPATDVWGLGVVLYELLTGVLPFERKTLAELVRAIVLDEPLPPRSLNPAIGPAVEAIVLRCLEKKPSDRFGSGSELAVALEAQLGAEPAQALAPVVLEKAAPKVEEAVPPPTPKPRREEARIHHRWQWDLDASPEQLWPLVSDTERFNQAIGLPPVEWVVEPAAGGDVRRIGAFRRLGMRVEWLEHPYEWVAPSEQGVIREYRRGPLRALWSRVRLFPRGTGTTLVHEVWIDPKGLLGRFAATIEMSLGTKQKIDAVYRAFDARALARARRAAGGETVPSGVFELPPRFAKDGLATLERVGAALESRDKPWKPLVARLTEELRSASDLDVARLRPYALAKEWRARKRGVLELFVAATRAGILETSWHLLCPVCRVPVATLRSLASVRRRSHCETCDIDYENDLARSIELVFRPSPAVRAVGDERYCPGGPGHSRHVLLQQELDPGETRELDLVLAPGVYRVVARGVRYVIEVRASEEAMPDRVEVTVDDASLRASPQGVRPGPVKIAIANAGRRRRVVRVEGAAWREEPLTALEACGSSEVRALVQDLSPAEPVQIGHAAYLAVTLAADASGAAREALAGLVAELTAETGGALVPREPPRAAFVRESDAIEAALRLHEAARTTRALAAAALRVAVHAGASVASAVGGGLGYEGSAPDLAVSLLEECQPGEVATTHLVLGAPGVEEAVGTRESRVQMRSLGREGTLPVIYLRA